MERLLTAGASQGNQETISLTMASGIWKEQEATVSAS